MERTAPTSTQPLPVVETVAAPVGPAETVALRPVPPAPAPLPPPPPLRRDRTPLIVGLLALGALLAIVMAVLAFAGRDRPAPPPEPAAVDPAETTVPLPVPEFPLPETSVPATTVPPATAAPTTVRTVRPTATTAARSVVTTRATIATAPAKPGKGGGGKGKD